jgi:hypothetical protein
VMGPNAPLPGAANAHKLAGAAGDAFWTEFWAVHEQLIDFAAIAAAHEDFFKSSGAAAAGPPMPGPAAAAAGKAAGRQPVVVAAEEQEEEGASVEIVMPSSMQPGRQPAGGAATTKPAAPAVALAAQPGRALLMAAKQPGALPPPQVQDSAKQQSAGAGKAAPASDGATPDWQLSVYWPEVGFAEFQPVAVAAAGATPREGQSFWPAATLGDGTAASGVDTAGAKLQAMAAAGSKRGSSASGTRLPTPRQGMTYGQQLKQAAAAGWQAWCRRGPGQSQSSRNLSELVSHTVPMAAFNTVSSNRELCSPAGGDE